MKVCHINQHGELCTPSGVPIENPSVLFEANTDIIHKIGDFKTIEAYAQTIIARYNQLGLTPPNLVTMKMKELSKEDACYIMRRAAEYSASGFINKLYQMASIDGQQAAKWLEDEKHRVIIDVFDNS